MGDRTCEYMHVEYRVHSNCHSITDSEAIDIDYRGSRNNDPVISGGHNGLCCFIRLSQLGGRIEVCLRFMWGFLLNPMQDIDIGFYSIVIELH